MVVPPGLAPKEIDGISVTYVSHGARWCTAVKDLKSASRKGVRVRVPPSAPAGATFNSGRARYPSRDSRASSHAGSWAERRGHSPAVNGSLVVLDGAADASRSPAAADCP